MIRAMRRSTLSGKRILLTRAEHQLSSVDRMLRSRGSLPLHFPCLALEPLIDELRGGMVKLSGCSDVLFTSINGVISVDAFCRDSSLDMVSLLAGKRIAAVGKQTAASLRNLGIHVDIIPATASQEGLVKAYNAYGLPQQLLFFRAEEGREMLAEALINKGVDVQTVAAYRTICPDGNADETIAMLAEGKVDAVLLGSTKTVRHYLQRIGSNELAGRPVIAVISQEVADAAMRLGLSVQVVAKAASFEAMLDALAEYFDANPS